MRMVREIQAFVQHTFACEVVWAGAGGRWVEEMESDMREVLDTCPRAWTLILPPDVNASVWNTQWVTFRKNAMLTWGIPVTWLYDFQIVQGPVPKAHRRTITFAVEKRGGDASSKSPHSTTFSLWCAIHRITRSQTLRAQSIGRRVGVSACVTECAIERVQKPSRPGYKPTMAVRTCVVANAVVDDTVTTLRRNFHRQTEALKQLKTKHATSTSRADQVEKEHKALQEQHVTLQLISKKRDRDLDAVAKKMDAALRSAQLAQDQVSAWRGALEDQLKECGHAKNMVKGEDGEEATLRRLVQCAEMGWFWKRRSKCRSIAMTWLMDWGSFAWERTPTEVRRGWWLDPRVTTCIKDWERLLNRKEDEDRELQAALTNVRDKCRTWALQDSVDRLLQRDDARRAGGGEEEEHGRGVAMQERLATQVQTWHEKGHDIMEAMGSTLVPYESTRRSTMFINVCAARVLATSVRGCAWMYPRYTEDQSQWRVDTRGWPSWITRDVDPPSMSDVRDVKRAMMELDMRWRSMARMHVLSTTHELQRVVQHLQFIAVLSLPGWKDVEKQVNAFTRGIFEDRVWAPCGEQAHADASSVSAWGLRRVPDTAWDIIMTDAYVQRVPKSWDGAPTSDAWSTLESTLWRVDARIVSKWVDIALYQSRRLLPKAMMETSTKLLTSWFGMHARTQWGHTVLQNNHVQAWARWWNAQTLTDAAGRCGMHAFPIMQLVDGTVHAHFLKIENMVQEALCELNWTWKDVFRPMVLDVEECKEWTIEQWWALDTVLRGSTVRSALIVLSREWGWDAFVNVYASALQQMYDERIMTSVWVTRPLNTREWRCEEAQDVVGLCMSSLTHWAQHGTRHDVFPIIPVGNRSVPKGAVSTRMSVPRVMWRVVSSREDEDDDEDSTPYCVSPPMSDASSSSSSDEDTTARSEASQLNYMRDALLASWTLASSPWKMLTYVTWATRDLESSPISDRMRMWTHGGARGDASGSIALKPSTWSRSDMTYMTPLTHNPLDEEPGSTYIRSTRAFSIEEAFVSSLQTYTMSTQRDANGTATVRVHPPPSSSSSTSAISLLEEGMETQRQMDEWAHTMLERDTTHVLPLYQMADTYTTDLCVETHRLMWPAHPIMHLEQQHQASRGEDMLHIAWF